MNDFFDARTKTGHGHDAGLDEPLAQASNSDSRHADQSRRRMSGWAVITTHPQAERWACANLARRGYACFVPTFIARRRDPVLRTLTRLVEVPLFAGYAFVHLDRRDPWTPVRYAPGVRMLLMDRDRVQFTRPGTVEALQQSEAFRRAVPPPDSVWAPGMPCSLTTGGFRDRPAVLVAIDGGVAIVALPMLGELRELTVPVDRLVLRPGC
jgi:hypothetical protein